MFLLLHFLLTTSLLPFLPSGGPIPAHQPTIPSSRVLPGPADSCHLNLPDEFFRGISAACSQAAGGDLCCPALTAWLLASYSAEALAAHVHSSYENELPVLPGETEPCAAAAEAALKEQGMEIQGANDTCGAVSCVCRVGLHPLQCSGSFVVGGGAEGRWVPANDLAESLEVDCERPGLGGCATCLKVLHELKSEEKTKGSIYGEDEKSGRECQIMGLTWLLSKNRTRYLPTATYVLRAFREAARSGGGDYPASCSVDGDGAGDMPLPVGAEQLLGTASSATARGSSLPKSLILFLLVIVFFL